MEQYGRAGDGSQSDPSPEWTGGGGETGLEESMWQLGLAGGESYPQRPDEADCIYYLRTGYCGYGSRCRFNHPRDRGAVIGAARTGGEYPERVGQPVCQYYMRTGSCKFGASCKYHHPRQGGTVAPVPLNYYGYPLRPGDKECSYYVKTGQCKFGSTCKFHHPQPSAIQVPAPSPVPPASPIAVPVPPQLYSPVQPPSGPSSQSYGLMVPRPSVVPGSFVQSPYGAFVVSPTIVPYPGWPPYQASGSPVVPPTTPPNVGATQFYGVTPLPSSATAYTGPYQFSGSSVGPSGSSEKEQSFPERPGQPECQCYMKTGDCKLGPSCRYHHPPELIAPKTNVALSPAGLPLRPGAVPCAHYTQRGVCKFGPACRFDHPAGALTYSPSASSLADMPVAPYPVGSSMATLAPPSSSSELQPVPTAGSNKESVSNKTSSSSSTSPGLVGSASSAGGPISQSGPQPSAQSSSPLVTITSTITATATTTTTTSTTASHTSS